jgi:MFS transporter, DHA1 family, multidrug resistance protein
MRTTFHPSHREAREFGLMVPMLFYLIGTGLIMPNAQAAVTRPFPSMIGTASSLFYFIEMLFGAFVGGIAGMLLTSEMPMTILIAICSILLFLSFYHLIWRVSPEYSQSSKKQRTPSSLE